MVRVNERILADNPSSLARWAKRVIGRGMQVKVRLRENKLHILCEGKKCPDRQTAVAQLVQALQTTNLDILLPAEQPRVCQVFLYGRLLGQKRPNWTERIDLDRLYQYSPGQALTVGRDGSSSTTVQPMGLIDSPGQPSEETGLDSSLKHQARSGEPRAIARYLGQTLKSLGVKVKVVARPLPKKDEEASEESDDSLVESDRPLLSGSSNAYRRSQERRLWVFCESAYSPDPSLLAEPVAQQLRELHLDGFRDAVILSQVIGEANPDWMLRVDLTPPEEMLKDWARWGDEEAIARLLNQALVAQGIKVSAVLKESTLHISCTPARRGNGSPTNQPEKQQCIGAIAQMLDSLTPRSIYAATIYGHSAEDDPPIWVAWLNLPAATSLALAKSALTLAQEGNEAAIAFLLGRSLNPDLNSRLATGGIRVQVRIKDDILYVMTDAPVCPNQRLVAAPSVQFVRQLQIPEIVGVKVYGRRTGQKQPLWSHNVDFVTRNRQQPETTPDFPNSDSYGETLIAEEPDASLARPTVLPKNFNLSWKQSAQEMLEKLVRRLVNSQLFIPVEETQNLATAPSQIGYQGVKVALVWGMVGILLTVSVDLVLGQILDTKANLSNSNRWSAAKEELTTDNGQTTEELSEISLRQSPERRKAEVFNTEGFTEPGNASPSWNITGNRATFSTSPSPFPSFNNPQLDEKLAVYQQRVEKHGPPDVLIVGSSRALRGIDPSALQKALAAQGHQDIEVFNFGVNGATAQIVDLMLRQILTPDQLPKLIIWADGARAFNSGRLDRTYSAIADSVGYKKLISGTLPRPSAFHDQADQSLEPFTATPIVPQAAGNSLALSSRVIDTWLNERLASVSATYPERDRLQNLLRDGLADKLSNNKASQSETLNSPALIAQRFGEWDGFFPVSIRFSPSTYYDQHTKVTGSHDKDYQNFQMKGDQAIALESLLQFTQARQIPVVFVNLPLTEDYLDPVRLKYEQEFQLYMLRLSLSREFIFRDWSQLWPDKNEYFSDPSHLNRYGASAVAERLAQDPLIPWPKR